jgi:HK97 family phage prohead protease
METKDLPFDACGIKFASAEGAFSGYGSVFGVIDSHTDMIMPGAFAEVIKSGDPVHVYVNHGWLRGELPVGKWSALSEDAKGLLGDAELQMKMPTAVNAYWAVKGALVSGLSIGYLPDPSAVERRQDGVRVIHRMKRLREISIVTDPSNAQAQITDVKSAEVLRAIEEIKTIRDLESMLRDAAGFTKGAAAALVARAKQVIAGEGEPASQLTAEAKALAQLAARLKTMAA